MKRLKKQIIRWIAKLLRKLADHLDPLPAVPPALQVQPYPPEILRPLQPKPDTGKLPLTWKHILPQDDDEETTTLQAVPYPATIPQPTSLE